MNSLLLTLAILHGGDAATTATALKMGARESNPLLPQRPAINVMIQGAEAAGTIYAIGRLSDTHPKLAQVLAVAGIVLEGYAVQNNIRVIRRQNR